MEDVEDSDEPLTKEAITLMYTYIMNCFIAVGYDTLEVNADLKTKEEPGYSLDETEPFITKECAADCALFGMATVTCLVLRRY